VKRYLIPFAAFLLGSTLIASFYIPIFSWAQDGDYSSSQFARDRAFVLPIIAGFAIQSALSSILRFHLFIPITDTVHIAIMMGATGGTSVTAWWPCAFITLPMYYQSSD